MDKKVEKFKADYADIKAKVKLIKSKLCDLRKEIKPVVKAAHRLYERGNKTMYTEKKSYITESKFAGLSDIMEDLGAWMDLEYDIQSVIDNTL